MSESKAQWSGEFPIFAGIDDLITNRDDLVIYIEDHIGAGDGVQEILEKARGWKFREARLVGEDDEADWYAAEEVEIDLLEVIEDLIYDKALCLGEEYWTYASSETRCRRVEPDDASQPWDASPPGETILECMNELGINTAHLSAVTGYTKRVWLAVFTGEREIDRDIADALSKTLGADAEFWLARERNYRQCLHKQQAKQDGGDQRDN